MVEYKYNNQSSNPLFFGEIRGTRPLYITHQAIETNQRLDKTPCILVQNLLQLLRRDNQLVHANSLLIPLSSNLICCAVCFSINMLELPNPASRHQLLAPLHEISILVNALLVSQNRPNCLMRVRFKDDLAIPAIPCCLQAIKDR